MLKVVKNLLKSCFFKIDIYNCIINLGILVCGKPMLDVTHICIYGFFTFCYMLIRLMEHDEERWKKFKEDQWKRLRDIEEQVFCTIYKKI